ncbi:fatty acid-binding protein DegV [Amycolatopsis antarctica]|uniref:Fatty acid-binding protein DegV n=1 Tax=Amycolatopsis antarctica TaxID=1854586 RepID=A0A263D7P0_9PSEU|nr:DegV family protein [Amycolatopsis antarctica]OZM74028.1 fatty acid-binding protein DegV [Amycolatopsis antarctica]
MSVAVVTDSTASLPAQLAEQWNVTVVPMQLKIGYRTEDEQRFSSPELIGALESGIPATTSPPLAATFARTYRQAAETGADTIVSIHLSGRMSATVEAARTAAAEVRVPVRVLDSETTGMSLGFAVLAAARAAATGAQADRVAETAERRFRQSSELLYVDTLEFLRKGGRIGAAAALVGTALSLKPVLTLREGEVAALTRVPGSRRAMNKVLDLAVERAAGRHVDLAVSHFGPDDRAERLAAGLHERLPKAYEPVRVDISAVLGAHLGPGVLGITVSPTG